MANLRESSSLRSSKTIDEVFYFEIVPSLTFTSFNIVYGLLIQLHNQNLC